MLLTRRWRLTGLVLLLLGQISLRAFTSNEVRTVVSSFNSNFLSVSGTNGYIKDTQTGGVAYFWGQAEMIECYLDAYEWSGDPVYKGMITNLLNGFIVNNGSSWSYNEYNDDILWAVIAFARGGVDCGNSGYCAIAKANFDMVYARGWDSKLGGGLYWRDSDRASKNACVNGPGAIAACLLYQVYNDPGYLSKASAIYAWERSVLFNPGSGAIYDSIGTNGSISYWASTYNQGTFIGAANFLNQTNDALLAANFTMTGLSSGGLLPEYGIAGNNSGFNAIFLRWMVRFMHDRGLKSYYEPWLQLNATAAWNIRRSDNLSWCQWQHPTPAGTNFYAWDCISSFSALLAADPTEGASPGAVPTDEIGYWPLDAQSGSSAVDISGNGNNAALTGPIWNSAGRFKNCLTFNGTNSYAQIQRPVANDFSLAFWVKTTQNTAVGQWYNGAALVDGDASGPANDFGTGLVGGRFAFGVGNPDTTVLSATAINNGVWHYCVATRQEATGVICVYVDGSLQGTKTATKNTLSATSNLYFGRYASGGGFFNGSLDEVRIFDRTLSGIEVAALYASCQQAPPTAPANFTATPVNGVVRLNWWSSPAATSYNVKRSLYAGGPYTTMTNVVSASFADAGIVANRTYYYVVSAVNVAGEGPDSAPARANTSSLVVNLKAEAISGVASGAQISVWPDVSGNGYNAVQPMSVNQPTYAANAINGRPAVHFNAANSSCLWLLRPVQDDFTIMLVFQSTQGVNTGVAFWNGAGLVNGEQSGAVNDFGMSINADGRVLAGTGNPDKTAVSAPGFNDGRPHIVTFKRTMSTGVIMLYVDGVVVGVATAASKQSLTAPNVLTLGAQAVLNNFLTGDIAEVQIYNSPLSDLDQINLENSLKCKYAIGAAAALTAPVGLAGSAGNRQITLTWPLIAGASGYDLWRSTNNGNAYELAAAGVNAGGYTDTHAANGLVNYYKVAALDACGEGANSAALGVLLPLPSLSMNVGSGSLALSWPDWATDWQLYSATNLTPPVSWTLVPNATSATNGAFHINLPVDGGTHLFRLSSP